MIKRLLIAYDGSESADKAFDFALELAKRYGAELRVLAVARPPEFAEEVEMEAVLENSTRHYESLLDRLKPKAVAMGVKAEFKVGIGHPAEQILSYAERHGVDHIVMGHRGKTLFERWRLGSVSRQVIHYAHCAVTVIR